MKDYAEQILDGEGENDYTRYMRTDALLSLQRGPGEWVHRDEMLFQIVHQSTELWLKLACAEVAEATRRIEAGELDTATRLLGRAALGGQLVTQQLEMMRRLSPWDFQTIRTILGHGSGADSPGWRAVRSHSRVIGAAFDKLVADRGIDLAEVYRTGEDTPEYRLAEAMIEWDDRISIWRVQHFKVITRIIGHQSVGTQGTPVDILAKLISHKLFPELWHLRTELTATGPMGDQPVREGL
ncbi:tryptophan 2,3-dioxygenase family protein [Streptomyces albidoflavus]|uniref:tryptophan 2,3-dioxygenase family protein n=1 Tax=Streptomyces albidoflavus TaxID=1886 RepID=UPI0033B781BF